MNLLVTGGTGFIGAPLCRALTQRGHKLVAVTRTPLAHDAVPGLRYFPWDDPSDHPALTWQQLISEVDGVIHLAGESIAAGRWTPTRKEAIRESRVQTTRRLVDAIALRPKRPAVFLSASAIGYYGPRGDEIIDETASPGSGFLADTCRRWEQEAQRADALGVRVIRLRLGVVLGPGGGALAKMVPPFRAFLGGPLGSGRQWMSWIHRDDVIGLIEWALTQPQLAGPLNATAPTPVTMREFCRELGRALRRPSWLPVPGRALRLLFGEMAQMLLTGQRVMPRAALDHGYAFRVPDLRQALLRTLDKKR
jgi:uncharacterized protein (TIGR01777 family)